MKSLKEQFRTKSYRTDKNSVHSYIDHVYDQLLSKKKDVKNILEIGVHHGGSILLWRDYFTNAIIDAVDINDCSSVIDKDRINHIVGNAYTIEFISNFTQRYDIIIDDGPHTLKSMIFFVENYVNILKEDGIAIIEDVQKVEWFKILQDHVPENFTTEVIDIRNIKNRYDDLLLIIKRRV